MKINHGSGKLLALDQSAGAEPIQPSQFNRENESASLIEPAATDGPILAARSTCPSTRQLGIDRIARQPLALLACVN